MISSKQTQSLNMYTRVSGTKSYAQNGKRNGNNILGCNLMTFHTQQKQNPYEGQDFIDQI
jgi:hypothetical protein